MSSYNVVFSLRLLSQPRPPWHYCLNMFDDLTVDDLAHDRSIVVAAGIHAAQLRATERLLEGPATTLGTAQEVHQLLISRDTTNPAWEWLCPFEIRWSLLVLRMVDGTSNQVAAIADARQRGASWAAIGQALGVTATSAHTRFAKHI